MTDLERNTFVNWSPPPKKKYRVSVSGAIGKKNIAQTLHVTTTVDKINASVLKYICTKHGIKSNKLTKFVVRAYEVAK